MREHRCAYQARPSWATTNDRRIRNVEIDCGYAHTSISSASATTKQIEARITFEPLFSSKEKIDRDFWPCSSSDLQRLRQSCDVGGAQVGEDGPTER